MIMKDYAVISYITVAYAQTVLAVGVLLTPPGPTSKRLESRQSHQPVQGDVQLLDVNECIAELGQRNKRAKHIIIHGAPESTETTAEAIRKHDQLTALNVIRQILPEDYTVRTMRLGKRTNQSPRLLRVIFGSADEARSILKNKGRYTGPYKITDDKTPMELAYLSRLRSQLGDLNSNGGPKSTIKYINGVPKIVNLPRSSCSRNQEI
ncbi:hypothetical protein KM043_010944 [Ampulex compressa]|nr:hypothetical protein KM043_010944 [Ampulex compressa]